jgi:hypothetical protein
VKSPPAEGVGPCSSLEGNGIYYSDRFSSDE